MRKTDVAEVSAGAALLLLVFGAWFASMVLAEGWVFAFVILGVVVVLAAAVIAGIGLILKGLGL